MNLENFVRPFQYKRVLTVERVVPARQAPAPAEPGTAILRWGAAGTVPQGVLQEKKETAESLFSQGFNTRESREVWRQASEPVTEEVSLPPPNDDVRVKRVREIKFSTVRVASADSNKVSSSTVEPNTRDSMAGVRTDIPANRSVSATYKTTWD